MMTNIYPNKRKSYLYISICLSVFLPLYSLYQAFIRIVQRFEGLLQFNEDSVELPLWSRSAIEIGTGFKLVDWIRCLWSTLQTWWLSPPLPASTIGIDNIQYCNFYPICGECWVGAAELSKEYSGTSSSSQLTLSSWYTVRELWNGSHDQIKHLINFSALNFFNVEINLNFAFVLTLIIGLWLIQTT